MVISTSIDLHFNYECVYVDNVLNFIVTLSLFLKIQLYTYITFKYVLDYVLQSTSKTCMHDYSTVYRPVAVAISDPWLHCDPFC